MFGRALVAASHPGNADGSFFKSGRENGKHAVFLAFLLRSIPVTRNKVTLCWCITNLINHTQHRDGDSFDDCDDGANDDYADYAVGDDHRTRSSEINVGPKLRHLSSEVLLIPRQAS